MLARIHRLASLWNAYSITIFFTIVMLLLRLLWAWEFQSRVGLIVLVLQKAVGCLLCLYAVCEGAAMTLSPSALLLCGCSPSPSST